MVKEEDGTRRSVVQVDIWYKRRRGTRGVVEQERGWYKSRSSTGGGIVQMEEWYKWKTVTTVQEKEKYKINDTRTVVQVEGRYRRRNGTNR